MSTGERLVQDGCLEEGSHDNGAGDKNEGAGRRTVDCTARASTQTRGRSSQWTLGTKHPENSRPDFMVLYIRPKRPSPQFPSRNHFLKAAREAGQRPKQDTSDGTDPAGQMGSSAPPGTEPGPLRTGRTRDLPAAAAGLPPPRGPQMDPRSLRLPFLHLGLGTGEKITQTGPFLCVVFFI